jgi:UDP-glucose 4-epimerase
MKNQKPVWAIIGASGFIGKNLCEYLLEKEQNVIAFDKTQIQNNNLTNCDWVIGDFFNKKDLKKAIKDADYVVHLVNTLTPASSNKDTRKDITDNLLGANQLIDLCIQSKIKRFITISSGGTVYGKSGTPPYTENERCEPICSYGIVKLAIENYLQMYNHLELLDSVVLRVSNPYGPYQICKGQGLVAATLERVIKGEPVEVWGDGSVIRDYVHIKDVVSAIYASVEVIGKNVPRLFNIGSGHGRSTNDVLATIMRIHGPFETVYMPHRSVDVPVSILNINRATSFLDWRPIISWEEGVKDAYSWAKLNLKDAV